MKNIRIKKNSVVPELVQGDSNIFQILELVDGHTNTYPVPELAEGHTNIYPVPELAEGLNQALPLPAALSFQLKAREKGERASPYPSTSSGTDDTDTVQTHTVQQTQEPKQEII